MATLVFDIETVPRPLSSFSDYSQKLFTGKILADETLSNDERALRLSQITDPFGLSPFTGEIITIGIYDLERRQGAVYYVSDETEEWRDGDYVFKSCTEREMLEDFWEGAQSYDVFVTFAGRMFDVPFVALRSVTHGIRPTKDLLEHRYLSRQTITKHVDLQDQLSNYGALGRRPSLHLCCETWGIESGKAAGVSGKDVAELFARKKFPDIARYNARDVTATTELYKKWYEFLAPPYFRNIDN